MDGEAAVLVGDALAEIGRLAGRGGAAVAILSVGRNNR